MAYGDGCTYLLFNYYSFILFYPLKLVRFKMRSNN